MRHLLESDLADEVKERMDECVARRQGGKEWWRTGMEGWRTGRELIVKDRRGKRGREGKFFKNVGDSGEDRCEKTMSGEKNVWMHV